MKIQVVIEATSIQEYTEAIQALAAGYTVAPTTINLDEVVNTGTFKSDSGQTNAPVKTTYTEAKQAVESDVVAEENSPKEQSYHRTAKKYLDELKVIDESEAIRLFKELEVESVDHLSKGKCTAFTNQIKEAILDHTQEDKPNDTTTPETEEKVSEEKTEASEPKYGFPAVKQIAMKLSKITDGKAEVKFLLEKFGADKLSSLKEENYDEFHKLASDAIADNDGTHSRFETKEDKPKQTEDNAGSTSKMEKEDSGVAEITLEMIRGKAKELSVAGYKEEIKAALKEIGAPALTKIPKDQYASFYETMSNLG